MESRITKDNLKSALKLVAEKIADLKLTEQYLKHEIKNEKRRIRTTAR
jgi:hypothetical protein